MHLISHKQADCLPLWTRTKRALKLVYHALLSVNWVPATVMQASDLWQRWRNFSCRRHNCCHKCPRQLEADLTWLHDCWNWLLHCCTVQRQQNCMQLHCRTVQTTDGLRSHRTTDWGSCSSHGRGIFGSVLQCNAHSPLLSLDARANTHQRHHMQTLRLVI